MNDAAFTEGMIMMTVMYMRPIACASGELGWASCATPFSDPKQAVDAVVRVLRLPGQDDLCAVLADRLEARWANMAEELAAPLVRDHLVAIHDVLRGLASGVDTCTDYLLCALTSGAEREARALINRVPVWERRRAKRVANLARFPLYYG